MNDNKRIASTEEVSTLLAQVKYAHDNHCSIFIQEEKHSESNYPPELTTQFTIADLFPDEPPSEVLMREIGKLTIDEYMHTVKDTVCPKKPEFHVFAKKYGKYVYIKFRVHLLSESGMYMFVMSFHYSIIKIEDKDFPYL